METPPSSSVLMSIELKEITEEDLGRVGVKAANQGLLLQVGFPVPDGIVLTTDAFSRSMSNIHDQLTAAEAGTKSLPAEVRQALTRSMASLGEGPLAVRSSAISEDLPEASFAGQYETVLGVVGSEEVEQAVRRCWSSVWTKHASDYRRAHGLDDPEMAILLQRMVEADAAGVAFTANPVTGDRREVVVNAVRGLGDRLVSGRASPDEWEVTDQPRCLSAPEGAIDAEWAAAIAELARRVEEYFGQPQDIEWAIADGRLYLLQARPITSLPEPPIEPIPIELEIPPGFWMYDASHNPRPGHPIDFAIFLPIIRRVSQRWAAEFGYLFDGAEWTEIGMWPYQRIVPLGGRDRPPPPTWMMKILTRLLPTLRRRVRRAIEVVQSDTAGKSIELWYTDWQPELDVGLRRHLEVDLTALTDNELVNHVESTLGLLERGIQVHMFLHGAGSMILYELASTCEELLGWDLTTTMDLVSGTSYKSTEPARQLHHLTSIAADRPAIGRLLNHDDALTVERLRAVDSEFADAFAEYLDHYAHRALGVTVAEPTLAEMPGTVLGLIKGQLDRGYDPEEEERAGIERRAAAAAGARARLAARPDDLERFERLLDRALRAYPVREDNEFFTFSSPTAAVRYAVLEVGRRLAERGIIVEAADVMHLELDQAITALRQGGDHRWLVERRKGERAWALLHPGPPFYGEPPSGPPSFDFLPPEARLPMEAMLWGNETAMAVGTVGNGRDDSVLGGIAASPGQYTGPVRVVMDETHFSKIQAGDVVVCPITSPVWSVLFPLIGALVTDSGGVLSHPAIIAREYGIPAVVATGTATSSLRDGDLVTVDGSSGCVRMQAMKQQDLKGSDSLSESEGGRR